MLDKAYRQELLMIERVGNGGFLVSKYASRQGERSTPLGAVTTVPELLTFIRDDVWPIEAVPVQQDDFTAWTGSLALPLDLEPETFVTVLRRDGAIVVSERARHLRWFHYEDSHPAHRNNIVGYKVVA